MTLLIFALLIVALFLPNFLLMRKQKQQRETIVAFQESLTPGKRVVTAGGYHATIVAVQDETVTAELAPGVVVTMEKSAVIRAADELIEPEHAAVEADPCETDGEDR